MPKTKRSPEGWARHYERAKLIKRRQRLDPEFRKLEAEKASERYYKNRDKYLRIAKEWREEHKGEMNERRKRWRKDNPELARIRDAKTRANSIKAWFTKLRRGDCTVDQFSERIRQSFTRDDWKVGQERSNTHSDSLRSSQKNSGSRKGQD